jgi:pimeloyl-ACP methyl ester carboxylesterase
VAPVLLIGHSLGSVIAWDVLWQLSHDKPAPCRVDLFLTIGSPLGTRYVQRRLMGSREKGRRRYPVNIRRWINVTSVGDLMAVDPKLRSDFDEMIRLGLIEEIRDHPGPVYNFYRSDEGLNVHRSYGYLVNPVVGGIIAEWWRARERGDDAPGARGQPEPRSTSIP